MKAQKKLEIEQSLSLLAQSIVDYVFSQRDIRALMSGYARYGIDLSGADDRLAEIGPFIESCTIGEEQNSICFYEGGIRRVKAIDCSGSGTDIRTKRILDSFRKFIIVGESWGSEFPEIWNQELYSSKGVNLKRLFELAQSDFAWIEDVSYEDSHPLQSFAAARRLTSMMPWFKKAREMSEYHKADIRVTICVGNEYDDSGGSYFAFEQFAEVTDWDEEMKRDKIYDTFNDELDFTAFYKTLWSSCGRFIDYEISYISVDPVRFESVFSRIESNFEKLMFPCFWMFFNHEEEIELLLKVGRKQKLENTVSTIEASGDLLGFDFDKLVEETD